MRLPLASSLAVLLALVPMAAQAQEISTRVGRLESEMRAVQRKVFPGGQGQYVEPDIAPTDVDRPAPGAPSSSAVNDLTQRVASLEDQIRDLTGRVEENDHRVRQLEDQFATYRRQTDARLGTGAGAGGDPSPPASTAVDRSGPPTGGDDDAPPPRSRPAPGRMPTSPADPSVGSGAGRDPARADRIADLQRPSTGDAPEDAYLYGYRLWQAKMYPEAEAQLKQVVTQYPQSKRASYAQNLLGRSYMDDGKLSLASIAFYDNYKKFPEGERAPDSLLFLGQALMKLNKPADACKVYAELGDVYGAKISAEMKASVARGRAAAKCK